MRRPPAPLLLWAPLLGLAAVIAAAAAEPIPVTIAGHATSFWGEALAGSPIELRHWTGTLARSTSDESGGYRFELELQPGWYQVLTLDDGVVGLEQWFEVTPAMAGTVVTVDLWRREDQGASGLHGYASRPPQPSSRPFAAVRVFYATDRARTAPPDPASVYAARRRPGEGLELGSCTVSIPKDHRLGELESPSIWRLEFHEDPARHVVLLEVRPQPREAFYAQLRERVGRSKRREAFVFVHGFLVSFTDAVRTTAQLAYDLEFDGAPILFSWPAADRLLGYAEAEGNAEWATPHLLAFLRELAAQSGAESVHLIAHSMGNRLVAQAMHQLALSGQVRLPLLNQLVLTAPDIDADVLRQLAGQLTRSAARVTLYASSNDQALKASMRFHSSPRAGMGGEALVTVAGIETVDVSEVDTSLLGHFYYGESRSVIADLYWLLKRWTPAAQRTHLRAVRQGPTRFWRLAGSN